MTFKTDLIFRQIIGCREKPKFCILADHIDISDTLIFKGGQNIIIDIFIFDGGHNVILDTSIFLGDQNVIRHIA
jgi:hypothetical protein